MKTPSRIAIVIAAGTLVVAGCVHRVRPFDEYLGASRWTDASDAFIADSSLMNDEDALYHAAILHGTPSRPTYRPERADSLLRRLLSRFPQTKYKDQAVEQRSSLAVLIRQRDSTAALERRISQLLASQSTTRQRLDSAVSRSDSLSRVSSRLEAELRDRDEQLRSLRLELQRLKEIDLKSSPPPRKPPPA